MDKDKIALKFDAVSVTINHNRILDDANLSIPSVGMTGLVGANGAGKSTLIKAALRLIPTTRGRIELLGRPPQEWRPKALAQRIGYLPQDMTSYWDLTVRELLNMALVQANDQLIDRCELRDLLDRRFATLSGGEKSRACLARAIAHDPELLFADEPTAHLDVPHQHQLMRLLLERAAHSAVVIVLHDLHLAATYCHNVAVIANQTVTAFGPPTTALSDSVLSNAYGHGIQRVQADGRSFFTFRSVTFNERH